MINEGPFSKGEVIMNAPPSPDLASEPPLSTLARWALTCAIAGFAILPGLVLAPILGFVALSRPALKTGAERGRSQAKAAIIIGICGTLLSVSLIWIGVSGKLDTARTQVADRTALSFGFDATSIGAIGNSAPTVSNLVTAISGASSDTLLLVNGRAPAKAPTNTILRAVKLSIDQPLGPVDVCLDFPATLNGAPKVVTCQ
jgi:hypothetical protein